MFVSYWNNFEIFQSVGLRRYASIRILNDNLLGRTQSGLEEVAAPLHLASHNSARQSQLVVSVEFVLLTLTAECD